MRRAKFVLGISLIAGGIIGAPAWADHIHSRVVFGVNFGMPIAPWYHYPYSPVIVAPAYPHYVFGTRSSAPVYIEKGDEISGLATRPLGYWYYCSDPQGYYPYIEECQTGWLTVLPQATGQPQSR
jgi:hypothetical protein